MPNLRQNEDGSVGIEGKQLNLEGGFLAKSIIYGATQADRCFFVAPRDYRVKAIYMRPDVADSTATTLVVRKAASGTAIGSGTALHDSSSPFTLNGTAATNQTKTLTTSSRSSTLIPQGTAIGIDVTGTVVSGIGVVTVLLAPA